MLRRVIIFREQPEQIFVTAVADGTEQGGDRNPPFTIYLGGDYIPVVGFNLKPGSVGGDQLGVAQVCLLYTSPSPRD